MARFWMATFKDGPAAPGGADKSGSAISVIEKDDEYAVIFSTVDDVENPTVVKCRVCFTNGLRSSAVGLDLGFPFADARVVNQGGTLEVRCPCFRGAAVMDYEATVARISGLIGGGQPAYGAGASGTIGDLAYEQRLVVPDCVLPGTRLTARSIVWKAPGMLADRLVPPPMRIEVEDTRYPQLSGFNFGSIEPVGAWTGTFDFRKSVSQPTIPDPMEINRADTFGVPSFRFDDLEVLGFRIDLADLNPDKSLADLARFCRPLNFHLDWARNKARPPGASVSDFRYQPASRTLMLELIRYGKMRVTQPAQNLVADDYQSQHELVVRMLVGRVDDDTGQAREPAVFAPAVFVDNTWSKVVGRSLQGFDKYMADFCVNGVGGPIKLNPDGALPSGGAPRALSEISEIRLAPPAGAARATRLLQLLSDPSSSPGWDDFVEIDLDVVYQPLGLTRWRQSDFDAREFRRSFAQSVLGSSLRGFRSVQVSPVGRNLLLRKLIQSGSALITGKFKIESGAQIAWPNGLMQLGLAAPPGSPAGWKLFCNLAGAGAGGDPVRITLPPGSWYRMRCSLDYIVDDDG